MYLLLARWAAIAATDRAVSSRRALFGSPQQAARPILLSEPPVILLLASR